MGLLLGAVVSGFPKRWDRWHSPSPNSQEKYHLYTTYILPIGGLYATYHLLGEPETTIDCKWLITMGNHGDPKSSKDRVVGPPSKWPTANGL